jgi:hypothetical protein
LEVKEVTKSMHFFMEYKEDSQQGLWSQVWMLKEILDGKVDLKNPKQVEVKDATENKGLWENLHNTRQCDEKFLRNEGNVGALRNETNILLADVLTKKSGSGSWIKEVISKNCI